MKIQKWIKAIKYKKITHRCKIKIQNTKMIQNTVKNKKKYNHKLDPKHKNYKTLKIQYEKHNFRQNQVAQFGV